MKKMIKTGMVVIALAGLANMASAATEGAYLGGGLGYSRLDNLPSIAGTKKSQDLNGLGGRVFAGFNFAKYFGMEAGLAHYATTTYKFTGTNYNLYMKGNALDVVGKLYLPISNSGFNVYALGGLAYAKEEFSASFTGKTSSGQGLKPKYGVGASFDINPHVTTSFEVSRIQGDNTTFSKDKLYNADMATVSFAYNFG